MGLNPCDTTAFPGQEFEGTKLPKLSRVGDGRPFFPQQHQPIVGICQLVYSEEGGQRFPVTLHEQQLKKIYIQLAGFTCLMGNMPVSLVEGCHMIGRMWLLDGNKPRTYFRDYRTVWKIYFYNIKKVCLKNSVYTYGQYPSQLMPSWRQCSPTCTTLTPSVFGYLQPTGKVGQPPR